MNDDGHRQAAIQAVRQQRPPSPGELPDLRAAYSDRSAALMAYLAAFAYHPIIGPKEAMRKGRGQLPQAEIPEELRRLGFTALAVYANGLTDGYAFIAEGPSLSVLSFRGTQSQANWKTNFHARLIHPEETDANLKVHAGFYAAFCSLAGDGLKEKIRAIMEARDDRPLYITGHSLGGALAQIAAAVFSSDKIAACYTFGSPRVGNAYFDLWVKPPSYRLINHADLVPQVPLPLPPLYSYRHAGDPRYLPAQVADSVYRYQPSIVIRLGQMAEGIVALLKNGSILGIEDHAIAEYCKKLDAVAAARRQGR